jgi:fibronectin-binding autotransporter adhesin
MPRPPLLKAENAWWVGALPLILALAFAPNLQGATVITGDVTPALPWSDSTTPHIGITDAGALAVDGGSQVVSGLGLLGYNAGSTGTATITGAGSKWTSSSRLYVGYSGSGALRVDAGGEVRSAQGYLGYETGGTGTATISGAGSKWTNTSRLVVGEFGDGTLRVEAGGQVSNTLGYLGVLAGTTGTATVTGAGSTWTNSSMLHVGISGNGTLTVDDGGHVTAATLIASVDDLHGNGTIAATSGAVLDADLQFNAAHPTQNVIGFGAGGTLTVAAAGGVLGAGYKGQGTLTIADGVAVSSSSGYLGFNTGSTGRATITGAGSQWKNSSALYVGRSGSGALTVENGGTVTAATLYASLDDLYGNGTIVATNGAVLDAELHFSAAQPAQNVFQFGTGGTLTVTAAGSNLGAGYKGLGGLSINEGVEVFSSEGHLGYRPGSTGSATITGAGSKWTNSSRLTVGYSGSGALHVEAGGQVSSAGGYLGDRPSSTGAATIAGAASKWTNSSALYIGYFGSGALCADAGAQITSTSGYLGFDSGSSGTATITGPGSKWANSSGLDVGSLGNGALRVEAGGEVSNASGYLGLRPGSTGTATITGAGSKWTSSLSLSVGHYGSGALRVEAGGLVRNTWGYLGQVAGSMGTATITGTGSKWTNSSGLYAGLSGSGALTITAGGLVSVRGTLTIDSNGGNDSFVNMSTGGMLALWGNADDSLAQFLGLVAGTDAIRYWSPSIANWSPLTAATLGVDYALQYQSAGDLTGYTLLTVHAAGPPGDFDFDGRVDGADFLAWQRGNSPTPNSPEDLATWRANLGLGAAIPVGTPAMRAVPEPGTLALVGLALAGVLLGCRSTRGRIRLV